MRSIDFVKDNNPLPIVKDDDDTELIPDKPDSTKKGNQYSISWNDYQNRNYNGTYSILNNNFNNSYKNSSHFDGKLFLIITWGIAKIKKVNMSLNFM